MPRNVAKPLSPVERFVQDAAMEALSPFHGTGQPVEVRYTKRDGDESSSTGTVEFFNGKPGFDTGSVTLATEDKGNRTINLHRIKSWRRA